jgi:uncharacterized protein YuzE
MVQSANELRITYDREADVLYCAFGDPKPAISVEHDNGVVVRFNPDNDEVVGVTILDFFKRFAERPDEAVSVPLADAMTA